MGPTNHEQSSPYTAEAGVTQLQANHLQCWQKGYLQRVKKCNSSLSVVNSFDINPNCITNENQNGKDSQTVVDINTFLKKSQEKTHIPTYFLNKAFVRPGLEHKHTSDAQLCMAK